MTTQPDIQAAINYGLQQGAAVLGQTMTVYRPTDGSNPIVPGNVTTTVPVYLSTDEAFRAQKANLYSHPVWYSMHDRTTTRVGDYLVGPQGTFFIVAQQPLLSTAVVECNRTLTFQRMGVSTAITYGPNYYAGDKVNELTDLMTSIPASVLQGTKGEKSGANLPDDVRSPWVVILVPTIPGCTIQTDDIAISDDTSRYVVSSAEQTDLGWRLTAAKENA